MMREIELLVTGSSGFIGTHLCRLAGRGTGGTAGLDLAAPESGAPWADIRADIRSRDDLRSVFESLRPRVVAHLAAVAEAVVPFSELENLDETNVIGTVKLLEACTPELFLFASSSAVYGNAHLDRTAPVPENMKPVGAYGMSKAQSELALGLWARLQHRPAVAFRFGNVVGERCRGLIPYLVQCAKRDPEGSAPTRLRGEGRIVRDYVPVGFTVALLHAAAEMKWQSDVLEIVNVGTGRGRTNADVAGLVQSVLREQGYELDLRFDAPLEPGEADHIVLDPAATLRRFDIPIPTPEQVDEAITEATGYYLSVTE